MGKDRLKKRSAKDRLRTYSQGVKAGFYITKDLIESKAWSVLSFAERMVLVEMLLHYSKLSWGDTRALPKGGMTFTHKMLLTSMDIKTFRNARCRLVDTGFFALAPRGRF